MDYPKLQLHVLEIFAEAQHAATSFRLEYSSKIWNERRGEKNEYERTRRARIRSLMRARRPPKVRAEAPPRQRLGRFTYFVHESLNVDLGRLPAVTSCVRCRKELTVHGEAAIRMHDAMCRPIVIAPVQDTNRDWSGKLPAVVSCVRCRKQLTSGSVGVLRAHDSNCRRQH